MNVLLKAIYRFHAIPIKLLKAFFTDLEEKLLQFLWKHKRHKTAKAIVKKKHRGRGIRLPNSKL